MEREFNLVALSVLVGTGRGRILVAGGRTQRGLKNTSIASG
jgi:hypothetical protein